MHCTILYVQYHQIFEQVQFIIKLDGYTIRDAQK